MNFTKQSDSGTFALGKNALLDDHFLQNYQQIVSEEVKISALPVILFAKSLQQNQH